MLKFLAAILLSISVAAPCRAGEVASDPPPATARELALTIGSPADPEAVRTALGALGRRDAGGAVRLARALALCGGHAAASGLTRLVRHWDLEVRVEALQAADDVGLRDPELLDQVRVAVLEDKPALVRAACRALSSIGDGSDVEILLRLAAQDDVETQLAAFRALRTLSGQRIPFVHARWRYWWKTASRRSKADVTKAIAYLEGDNDGERAEFHEDTLRRNAWMVLADVQGALERWLGTPDKQARARACRLAGDLGLVAHRESIRSLLRFAFNDDLAAAARRALAQLGVEP